MTIAEAFAAWRDEIRPLVVADYGDDDMPALSESWNDYTDALCKDGKLTGLQYHYCPAHDDDMPSDEDEERDFILDQLGVTLKAERSQPTLAERGQWGAGASHWFVTLARGDESVSLRYHMGAAHTGLPQREDVVASMLMDWRSIEETSDFEEWAEECGYDTDSRKAEAIYETCRAQSEDFEQLFRDISMDDLHELFEDF